MNDLFGNENAWCLVKTTKTRFRSMIYYFAEKKNECHVIFADIQEMKDQRMKDQKERKEM